MQNKENRCPYLTEYALDILVKYLVEPNYLHFPILLECERETWGEIFQILKKAIKQNGIVFVKAIVRELEIENAHSCGNPGRFPYSCVECELYRHALNAEELKELSHE